VNGLPTGHHQNLQGVVEMITAKISAVACLALAPLAAAAAPVPWLDEPGSMTVVHPIGTAPSMPCEQGDLRLTLGGTGAYRGHATQELLLLNRSSAPCLLNAAPAIELASPRGWQAAGSMASQNTLPNELPAHATLAVLLGTPGACEATMGPGRQVLRRLRVLAPGGGALEVDGAHVDITCGAATVLRADLHETQIAPAAGSTQVLTAELSAPRNATAGTQLDYVVTLRNPTGQPVSLAACPSYEQVLNTTSGSQSGALRLNCAGAGGLVPAHGELQFAMRARVPDAPGHEGAVKLSWRLLDGPAAGTVISLR
jgi:hypothetical protein